GPPNGRRVSGSRRAEGDERVRCTRMLGPSCPVPTWLSLGYSPVSSGPRESPSPLWCLAHGPPQRFCDLALGAPPRSFDRVAIERIQTTLQCLLPNSTFRTVG